MQKVTAVPISQAFGLMLGEPHHWSTHRSFDTIKRTASGFFSLFIHIDTNNWGLKVPVPY